nr:1-phosphofructokinase [uncultured Blautia sp.]
MIYTVTFNPSLDYIVGVDGFKTGKVNRTAEELILPGGKGINVSIVLQNLGMESIPLGFAGGFTGEEIRRLLKERKVEEQFVRVKKGISRINVKLRSLENMPDGEKTVSEESEINGMGPEISGEELETFYRQLDTLQKGDILVLAGSIPTVLPPTIYRDIMKRLQKRKVMIVVDATKDLLVNVLEYHPFLIKPNNYELGEIFGVTLQTKEDVVLYAKKLQEMGAGNVLVSMAGDGAVLVAEDGSVYRAEAPEGRVRNSVGAGDSMVAGFLYGYLNSGTYEDAFYYGICSGSASAFSENLATRKEVEKLLKKMKQQNMETK